jgi:osmotically-inducible protein OsmY
MATVAFSGTDVRVRDAVMRQLAWDPDVDASAVGVAAKDGAVTLTGYIDTYAGKLAAERAAKRVHGVRAVANDLEVRLKLDRTDTDIAQDAARALGLHDAFPDTIQAAVHHGHVALTGTIGKLGLREQAERVVRHIRGVRGVANYITVSPQLVAAGVKRQIVKALHETADVEARQIEVELSGDVVRLAGTVATWLQRAAAERAVANAPGITRVINEIVVAPAPRQAWEPVDEIC